MPKTHGQRSPWQVLGLYGAGSWVVLQVVDLLTDRLPLPSWTFTLTIVLLGIGLPITAATAYLQGFLVRHGSRREGFPHRLLTWRNVLRGAVGGLAVWGVAVTGFLLFSGGAASQWDAVTGMAEIDRLAAESRFAEGYAIAEDLDARLDGDSLRAAMWARVSVPVALRTEPAGARVFRRDYAPAGAPWEELGDTPLSIERFRLGLTRLRFELGGYRTREIAVPAAQLPELGPIALDREADLAPGMVRVTRGGAGGPAPPEARGLARLPSGLGYAAEAPPREGRHAGRGVAHSRGASKRLPGRRPGDHPEGGGAEMSGGHPAYNETLIRWY